MSDRSVALTAYDAPPATVEVPARSARARPLWHFLALLIALAVLPIAAIAVALLTVQARAERAELERGLRATAQALSLAVDREVLSYRVLLQALAESESLQADDLERFHRYAKRVAERHGVHSMSLFARDGVQLLNTARRYGAALPAPALQGRPATETEPPRGDAASLGRVFATGQPSNSQLFRTLTTDQLVFTVDVPVMRDGAVKYSLNVAADPTALAPLVTDAVHGGARRGVIVDANGFVLASWSGPEVIGKRAIKDYLEARLRSPSFVTEGVSREGERVLFAAHTSELTGWTSVANAPRAEHERVRQQTWVIGGLLTAASLLLGCVLASRLAKRIDLSIRSLVDPEVGAQASSTGERLAATELDDVDRALSSARAMQRRALADRERQVAAEARQRELERAAAGKDLFIATLSHELRNPLSAISNAITIIKMRGPDPKAVAILERQLAQLVRLVDDLLDTARVSQGKIRLTLQAVDLRAVLHEVIDAAAARLAEKRQQLVLDEPEEPVRVLGDQTRLAQVLGNLVENASRYSLDETRITVTLAARGESAHVIVRDYGRGMSPSDLERVFEPFVQLANGGSLPTEGLGLGLPLVKQLVEQHGGSVSIESEGIGRGCTVTVTLPLLPN